MLDQFLHEWLDRVRVWSASRLEAGRGLPMPGVSLAVRRPAPAAARGACAVVCVGGATLGGSGKTPVAIACARALAESGARVALVGHAHRARPCRARRVRLEDSVLAVGDEALLAARALAGVADVVVAESRARALELACAGADVVVLDGPLQLEPRAALSILAVDARAPWGAGRLLPRGDLRAPPRALLSAADLVVAVGDADAPAPTVARGRPTHRASYGRPELWRGGARHDPSALAGARIGLVTALARPDRVERQCARLGLVPEVVVRAPDHGPSSRRSVLAATARERNIDAWITTEKCALSLALSLPAALDVIGAGGPWILRAPLSLDTEVVRALATLAALTVARRSQ